ncbi:MAG: hypothetical protein FJ138_09500 [Deltaproteobacteria bacterium]|nr:hypothetical protein [Deltaproteobacteria bacterium]
MDPLIARFVEELRAQGALEVREVLTALGLDAASKTRFFGALGAAARWRLFEGECVVTPWRRERDAYRWVEPRRA